MRAARQERHNARHRQLCILSLEAFESSLPHGSNRKALLWARYGDRVDELIRLAEDDLDSEVVADASLFAASFLDGLPQVDALVRAFHHAVMSGHLRCLQEVWRTAFLVANHNASLYLADGSRLICPPVPQDLQDRACAAVVSQMVVKSAPNQDPSKEPIH